MSLLSFTPGTAVEVNIATATQVSTWYPGTVIKELGEGSFLVKYEHSNELGIQVEVVKSIRIRPSPPSCNNKAFQLLDKVEAFCNTGWLCGIVTKILSEGRYTVFFRHTNKDENFCHTNLRLPMTWTDGKWVLSSQDDSAMLKSREATAVCNTTDNNKRSVSPYISGIVKETWKESIESGEDQAVASDNLSLGGIIMKRRDIKEDKNELSTTKMTSARKRKGLPKRKRQGTIEVSPAKPQKEQVASEGILDPFRNTIVISLPCDSLLKSLGSPRFMKEEAKLLTGDQEPAGDKEQLDDSVKHGDVIKDVKTELTPPKRKRGRPCGSSRKVSREAKKHTGEQMNLRSSAKKPVGEQTKLQTGGKHMLHSRFAAKSVGRSTSAAGAMVGANSVSSRGKRLRKTRSILSTMQGKKYGRCQYAPELQVEDDKRNKTSSQSCDAPHAPLGEKSQVALTSGVARDANKRQGGLSNYISDDDRPLSTWYPPPAIEYPEISPVGNASQNERLQHVHQLSKVTNGDVGAVEHVNQSGAKAREKENEKVAASTTDDLPFLRSSCVWEAIDSMDVFRRLPQRPHFRPLYKCNEHCREGLAIGSMVTFSNLVDKISQLQLDDPKTVIVDSMDSLLDLEKYGFDVEAMRGRLGLLLGIKNKHEEALNQSKEIEALVTEREQEKEKLDAEIYEIDQKLAELQERRALVISQKGGKDSEIVALESKMKAKKETFEGNRSEFERVATAPW